MSNNTRIDFLYLSEEDMIKAGVLDMDKCVESIDEMFRLMGTGDYLMGGPHENDHGIMLWFPREKRTEKMPVAGPDRRFLSMPAYLGGRFYVCGQKWYGSNRANLDKGLPRSILTVMLNDVDTGAPLALMSANLLSSMRTGAVPGVATRYLQSSNASTVGIIGAGVISNSCMRAIAKTIKDKGEGRVYDIFPAKATKFCEDLEKETGMKMTPVSSLREAVEGCDIVSVAASGAQPVIIEDEWIKDGAVIEITGAAQLSEKCYAENHIVVDNWKMHEVYLHEMQDIPELLVGTSHITAPDLFSAILNGKVKVEDITSLGDVIENPALARKDDKEKVIFITSGMPTEDLAWGYDVYQEALRQGIGQTLTLWEKPYLA